MRWPWQHQEVLVAPDPFADDDIPVMTYEEPPRGDFDWPHRIRSAEQLAEESAQPLPEDAANRALAHMTQRRQVHDLEHAAGNTPVDWADGVEASEEYDPDVRDMVRAHQMRQTANEVEKMLQTPFMQRMLGLQTTYLRWKKHIKKFGSKSAG